MESNTTINKLLSVMLTCVLHIDREHREVPLNVTITPQNKTTLLVEWVNPPIYDNITYEFVLSVGQNYQETVEVMGSSVEINLEEQECQPFQINISMPGNCDDVVVMGSLLIGEWNVNGKHQCCVSYVHVYMMELLLQIHHTQCLRLSPL